MPIKPRLLSGLTWRYISFGKGSARVRMGHTTPRSRKKRGGRKRLTLTLALLCIAALAGWIWLQDHPEHNPLAPFSMNDPVGIATAQKLVRLRSDIPECRAVLDRGAIVYTALPETGGGPCARPDRTKLEAFPLSPNIPAVTCPVAVGLEMWRRESLDPAARDILGSEIVQIEHMGVFNCRRIRGSNSNNWSQHSTGNAIDISAFILADGRRISVLDDWSGDSDRARFLQTVRDDACGVFATVLSPDYNAAHADHFHLDQGRNWVGICR